MQAGASDFLVRPVAPEAKPQARMLRLSIGLEDPADIIDDLVQALESTR